MAGDEEPPTLQSWHCAGDAAHLVRDESTGVQLACCVAAGDGAYTCATPTFEGSGLSDTVLVRHEARVIVSCDGEWVDAGTRLTYVDCPVRSPEGGRRAQAALPLAWTAPDVRSSPPWAGTSTS